MVYIPKKCIGCHSNKRHYSHLYRKYINTIKCKVNIGEHNKDYKIFRNQYCPCVECLVKAMCTEPKINRSHYRGIIKEVLTMDKCKLLRDQINKFKWSK